jgi:hypothetical protein
LPRLDRGDCVRILRLPMCPHCGREAPIVYRGVVPYCTACGGLRVPLSGPSVNLAGTPAKVGGAFARVAGVLALIVGLSAALGVWLLAFALSTPGIALAFALPIALIALGLGGVLLGGAYKLRRVGDDAEMGTRESALVGLAAQKGGVTAADAARTVGMTVAEADAILTSVAKRQPERLSVDIDDQGAIWFRPAGWAHVRVGSEGPRGPRVGGLDAADADDVRSDGSNDPHSEDAKARR